MASAEDIAQVRLNSDEPDSTNGFTDDILGDMIDVGGILGATVAVWDRKAGLYADQVNVSEAGASHSFSDLHKNALDMARHWASKESAVSSTTEGRPRVHRIVRD